MKINEISKSVEETYNLGMIFSKGLSAGSIIGLIGDLASGKTTFVKGILKGLNYKYEVTSPTFTLINEYPAKIKVLHIDFYRDNNLLRWQNIGFQEMVESDAIVIIEWADLLPDLLPKNLIKVYFEHYENKYRKIFVK
tara:strand:- start:209 stop:622 length:414 start_codon:yes stop_codon:yes gene_type:complete